ncbi:hypothetical protein GCM10023077_41550 [Mycolicibacterium helvum]
MGHEMGFTIVEHQVVDHRYPLGHCEPPFVCLTDASECAAVTKERGVILRSTGEVLAISGLARIVAHSAMAHMRMGAGPADHCEGAVRDSPKGVGSFR